MDDFADAPAGSIREKSARFTHSRILLVSFNANVRSEISIQTVLALFGVNSRRASRLVNWFLKRAEANRDVFGHRLFRQTLLPGSRPRRRQQAQSVRSSARRGQHQT